MLNMIENMHAYNCQRLKLLFKKLMFMKKSSVVIEGLKHGEKRDWTEN